MADPRRFVPPYNFSDFESTQPQTPKPGVQLDNCFNDISQSTTELVNAVKDVRRSDGALKNGIVTHDSLQAGLLATLRAETDAALVETYAQQAAGSATSAATSASELDAAVDVIAQLGALLNWGEITEPAGTTFNYGDL